MERFDAQHIECVILAFDKSDPAAPVITCYHRDDQDGLSEEVVAHLVEQPHIMPELEQRGFVIVPIADPETLPLPKTTGEDAPILNLSRDAVMNGRYGCILLKYFGIQDIDGPISMNWKGQRYSFDFRVPPSGRLIKIFTEVDRQSMMRYAKFSEKHDVLMIIDTARLPEADRSDVFGPYDVPLSAGIASANIGAYIFHQGGLMEFVGDLSTRHLAWNGVAPACDPANSIIVGTYERQKP